MQTNEAPEKIYHNPLLTEEGDSIVRRCTFEKLSDSQIEYVRADTFIEKACEWLEDHIYEYLIMNRTMNEPDYDPKLIGDFRNYLN